MCGVGTESPEQDPICAIPDVSFRFCAAISRATPQRRWRRSADALRPRQSVSPNCSRATPAANAPARWSLRLDDPALDWGADDSRGSDNPAAHIGRQFRRRPGSQRVPRAPGLQDHKPAGLRKARSLRLSRRKLIAAERLLRLSTANAAATPRRVPLVARVKSPIPGSSTLTMSAPRSPRIIFAIGPERFCVTPMTRMPLNRPVGEASMISFLF